MVKLTRFRDHGLGADTAGHPDADEAKNWRFDRPDTDGTGPGENLGGQSSLAPSYTSLSGGEAKPEHTPGWDIKGCLWRRRLLIGGVALGAMAVFATGISLVPKSYRSSSTVIFQGDRLSTVRDDGTRQDLAFAPDTLANEIEMLVSEELLTKAVVKLDLLHNPEFTQEPGLTAKAVVIWGRALAQLQTSAPALMAGLGIPAANAPSPSPTDAMTKVVAALRDQLSIGPVGISRVIKITAQSGSAESAAMIANGVAATYVDTQLEAKTAATREAHFWVQARLDDLRDRAAKSAQAYEAFRHNNDIVRGKDSTISQEQVTQISTELTQTRQGRTAAEQALSQAASNNGTDLDMLAFASGSVLLPKLREQLSVATARKAELETTGGAFLPSIVANRAQVAEINRSIAVERSRIRQTLQGKVTMALAAEQRLGTELTALKAKVELSDSSGAQIQALERTATADADLYRNFMSRSQQTDPDLTYQSANARVLSSAVVPLQPVSPNKRVLVPLAMVLSLGLGVVAAFGKENRRRGIHSLRDLPRPSGQAPLGMLPRVGRRDRALSQLWDESVAQILARVLLPIRGVVPASILVTSALPKEGKTRTAIALATAAHNRGLRVLLVDADLRCRSASKEAGMLHSDHSLVRLLRGEITFEHATVFHDAWGFAVLPAGVSHESPMRLLATDAWEGALRDLETMFDLVIVDTPPVLAAGDTWLLARYADVSVLVSKWGSTTLPTVQLALEQLSTAQARVAGVVLTQVDHREHASYGYSDSVMFSPELMRYHNRRRRLA
jgi:succinoglycan biosynthesis transport protein ExoP